MIRIINSLKNRSFHRALAGFVLLPLLCLASLPGAAEEPAKSAPDTLQSTDDMRATSGEMGERALLPGALLYAVNCATCHDGQVYKAPHKTWLEMMPARSLYLTMNSGVMSEQAAHLSEEERVQIVEYLLQERFTNAALEPEYNYCEGDAAEFSAYAESERTGWGADTSRFVPAGVAGLTAADIPRLKLKWSFGFPGSFRARSQPTVGMGAIFVGSQDGTVYALDLASGCVRWAFQASAEVRTGVVLARAPGDSPAVYFGDIIANVYALDAQTGALRWRVSADEHHSATITGTPAVHENTLYVPVSSLEVIAAARPDYDCCTFRGKVVALGTADGAMRWETFTVDKEPVESGRTSAGARVLSPSGAPVWVSPTVDAANNRLFFGSGENYSSPPDKNSDALFAVRMDTGERIWSRQVFAGDAWNVACMMANNPNCPPEDGPDYDQASSPLLIDLPDGGEVLVAGHKDGSVIAYDAQDGSKRLWVTKVGRGSIQGGVHFGMAAEGTRIYAPINDMNNTYNGDVHDITKSRPGIHAIDAVTGKVLWSHVQENVCSGETMYCDPGISSPVTAIPDAVIAGHLDGYLRAYSGVDGNVLWEYNTAVDFDTVNGVPASGGSMSGAGPTVAKGYVISNSGYGLYQHDPGNALLVFTVDGK